MPAPPGLDREQNADDHDHSWDNAPMESFFHSLKTEWVVFEDYKTRLEAGASLFDYIELFYNRKRRHSALKYRSPIAFELAGGVS